MTAKSSTARLVIYILISMLTTASAGLPLDFSNPNKIVGFFISVLVAGLVTARSYIDQSPTQVPKDKEEV